MRVNYVEVLSACLVAVVKKMTDLGPLKVQAAKGEPPSKGLPVAQVIEYRGREADLQGYFVLGFPSQAMAVRLSGSLAAKMGLPAPSVLDRTALDLLGEFMNTVVGHATSAWDRLGMSVQFGPPSPLQQAQVQPVEGYENHSHLITLDFPGGRLVFCATLSQSRERPQAKRRVLVVEDSETLRHVLCKNLAEAGYEVARAGDGLEAIEVYQAFGPELVLMDLVMPRMGGLDAIMAILEKDPQARFVVLTSSHRLDEVITAKTLGVLDYLIKPVDNQRLLQTVKKALGSAPAGQATKTTRSKR